MVENTNIPSFYPLRRHHEKIGGEDTFVMEIACTHAEGNVFIRFTDPIVKEVRCWQQLHFDPVTRKMLSHDSIAQEVNVFTDRFTGVKYIAVDEQISFARDGNIFIDNIHGRAIDSKNDQRFVSHKIMELLAGEFGDSDSSISPCIVIIGVGLLPSKNKADRFTLQLQYYRQSPYGDSANTTTTLDNLSADVLRVVLGEITAKRYSVRAETASRAYENIAKGLRGHFVSADQDSTSQLIETITETINEIRSPGAIELSELGIDEAQRRVKLEKDGGAAVPDRLKRFLPTPKQG